MCGAKSHDGGQRRRLHSTLAWAKGSKYALVVGDKVYTLDSGDKAVLAALDKLAGENAKVTGTANGRHHYRECGCCRKVGPSPQNTYRFDA